MTAVTSDALAERGTVKPITVATGTPLKPILAGFGPIRTYAAD